MKTGQIMNVLFVRVVLDRKGGSWPNLIRSFVTFDPKLVKWSSGQKNEDQSQKKKKANTVKRINWENYNLFGPLQKSASDRRREKTRTTINTQDERDETVTIRVKEAGYKHLDGPPIVRKGKLSKEEVMRHGFETELTSPSSFTEIQLNERQEEKSLKEWMTSFPLSHSNGSSAKWVNRLSSHWMDNPSKNYFPSVSTILQRTMSAESVAALERWERRMILKLGEEGFQKYKQETFDVGSNFHRCIQKHLTGEDVASVDVEDNIRAHWSSLKAVLSHVSDVSLIETKVRHPFLHYGGILDCVARYRGTTMLIEWKTSQRPKSSLEDMYDNPLQAIAYLGALSFQKDLAVKVDRVALVVAYSSGSPAHVHCLDEELCQRYWTLWLQRLYAFFQHPTVPEYLLK